MISITSNYPVSQSLPLVPTSAPTDTSGRALSSNSIYLSWDLPPPLERHGIIREYHINLTEQETGIFMTYTSSSMSIEYLYSIRFTRTHG